MPFRLSERTSSSSALSTISRFVFSRVSLRALLTKLLVNLDIRSAHVESIHHFSRIWCTFLSLSSMRPAH